MINSKLFYEARLENGKSGNMIGSKCSLEPRAPSRLTRSQSRRLATEEMRPCDNQWASGGEV